MRTPRAGIVIVTTALLLGGCGMDAPRQSPPVLEFPPAPLQLVPESAAKPDKAADAVPLADLARPEWLRDVSESTAIPERALAAYAGASLRLAQTRPECGVGWNTLAGIGAVETIHGSYGGASASTDGTVRPSIIGIALDGSEGVKEILDTDKGELDGDEEYDRAVGPMQFIPTTWKDYAEDGNLDGETDPNQIDDAALTAALYLCDSGGDVTTDDGWSTALGTYNQSVSYAHKVAELAESYTP
ncbi:lytic transglycosylase domain-containing protein [Promicromonospora aerolata]|uniref:Lytic transglycosylase domain-containing protein n=1 Tax=Promicromonospora aerolata TaxID=195749 RepID=A0ABW4VJY9_9MICO